jgi:hypothetical protein
MSREQLGYFMAGIIDYDGTLTKRGYIKIAFNTNELSVAYYLQKVLGGGSVYHAKKQFVSFFDSSSKIITLKIANLIRNKLKHLTKIEQFNTRLVPKYLIEPTFYTPSDILNNHWLAGLIQGDGSLSIKILLDEKSKKGYLGLALRVEIAQKADRLLIIIEKCFKGTINFNNKKKYFTYLSGGFSITSQLIAYLDQFQLIGNKLSQYWHWRAAYILVQSGNHLSLSGRDYLLLKKEQISFLRSKKLDTVASQEREIRRLEVKKKSKTKKLLT